MKYNEIQNENKQKGLNSQWDMRNMKNKDTENNIKFCKCDEISDIGTLKWE